MSLLRLTMFEPIKAKPMRCNIFFTSGWKIHQEDPSRRGKVAHVKEGTPSNHSILLDQPLQLILDGAERFQPGQLSLQKGPLSAVGKCHKTGQLILMSCFGLLCLPGFFFEK